MSTAGTLPPPPDGGFHAWAQVVSGHLVVAVTWGYAASFGVFQDHYEVTLPQTSSDISWIGGFQVFCLLFMSPLSGRATDAGQARLVVGIGAFLLLLGTFMTSLARVYWQLFLSQGLCIGIGQGLMWLPSVTLVSTYFVRRRVFAVTAAATGTSTGGIIFPAMIQFLSPRIGFPWAVRCMGLVVFVMLLIILALLRPRLPPRKSGPLIEWGAFTEPAYMLFTLGVFLLYWTLYFAFFYIQVYATDRLGLSARAGVNLVIVINVLGIPIRAPCGYLADRYLGPLNCLIPWVSICGVLMFCWAGVHNVAGLYIFAVFYGLASAAAMGLFAGTVPSLTKDLDKIGTRVGMALAMISFGPLTGPSVAGALIAQSGDDSYLPAQLWAGAALMVGALALVGARIVITGPHLLVKV
ncbi:riboflavin transporter MCH5 [Aspergillus awamori]|uniref:MFS monocarboxylate transporter n=2 Tax=Aspergillus TaxID=5052 RepID=A0A3F3Q2V9_9EURO|nr:MFS monocarboxylate transporter [Aspergillus welwitschiae]RDH33508.1 MFS monocarboxylate transporter [Aspergillus welwitschiae]GCB23469.1 riboflavin transporter MCH5 [Aspergillus awamori]